MAAGHVRLRSRDVHRRHRPGRGGRAGARQGAAARHQEKEHLHRGPARGIRPRLRVPDVPRQRRLRRRIPARHVDRAPADRQAPDRDRARRPAPTPSRTAPPARATTRSASSSARTRSRRTSAIIAPWREWDLLSREKLLAYADEHGIPVDFKKRTTANAGGAPYSMDANLLHISYEGGILEDPAFEPEESMWRMTVRRRRRPESAGGRAHVPRRRHRGGRRTEMTPAAVLTTLNEIGGDTASAGSTWSRTATSA